MHKTSNRRILAIESMLSPAELTERFPVTEAAAELVVTTRENTSQILHKKDDRLLVVVGPCSVHDPAAAIEYAEGLSEIRSELADQLEIVMRVYFEKPRTRVGWKGLINDPDLDGQFNINKGLQTARKLLLDLHAIGVPAGCEFLDAVSSQCYADLVSWGAIGARTTESQIHRELASGLSCPIGFKNGTNGNLQIAVDAVIPGLSEHSFLGSTEEGQIALFRTSGNPDTHVILRGGKKPNYDRESVAESLQKLDNANISTGLIIDFSHANCDKQFARQIDVGNDVADQVSAGETGIVGCMIENNLVEGRQNYSHDNLVYGQSITDPCLGWSDTKSLLHTLANSVDKRRSALKI
jgi:3-deoxy-7-phosphoheptulonate synthase